MNAGTPGLLERFFRTIVARRWWVAAIYALLLPPAVLLALKVDQDNSPDALIVRSDPDYLNTREFEKVFGAGEYVLLLAEADDPFSPEVLTRVGQIEDRLGTIPGVSAHSVLTIFRQAREGAGVVAARPPPGYRATPEQAEEVRRFVEGTTLFREQGLVGSGFLAIPVALEHEGASDLRRLLGRLDTTLSGFEKNPAPLTALRKIGGAYVNAYLDAETARSTARFMPFFAALLLALNLALYRSFRALAAFVLTLAVAVALTMGYVGLTGGVLTIVSPLVPMTVLITATATLVYIHSRFVDQPEGVSFEDHQILALTHKFTACTASLFAAAVGFAALTVSKIRPIRDLGVWVAVGMLVTWVVVFTLFPALQRILGTPTRLERRTAGDWFHRLADRLPLFTWRWRWPLVAGSLALCAVGAVSVFGLPGLIAPMSLETDGIEYVNPASRLYRDTKRYEQLIAGLSVTEIWVRGGPASLTDPEVLRGLDHFHESLRAADGVGSVAGPTTVLRLLRYLSGEGDRFPDDPQSLGKLATDLELLLQVTPALRGFVDEGLSQARLTVVSRSSDFAGFRKLDREVRACWERSAARFPVLGGLTVLTVGLGPLQAKVSHYLVPTLVESFAITVGVLFLAFLVLFRSGPARLMAMIPSLFAILVMFAVMRVTGMSLNVATILIASTVLGSSENDQIHFFYHFLERRRNGTVEEGLAYTLRIAGKAIFYATMINAGGFLAFAFADLPPMRQFGILTALAFTLSMLADFTALPAALWIVCRDRPHSLTRGDQGVSVDNSEPSSHGDDLAGQ